MSLITSPVAVEAPSRLSMESLQIPTDAVSDTPLQRTVKKCRQIVDPGSSATVFAVTGLRQQSTTQIGRSHGYSETRDHSAGKTVLQERLNAALEK